KLGESLPILGQEMTIVGLYRSPVANVPFLSGGIVMPLENMCQILAPNIEASGNIALLHVYDSSNTGQTPSAQALADLDQRTAELAQILPKTFQQFKIQSLSEYLDTFQSQLQMIDQFAWAISILAVIAGGIGIMNT